MTQRSGLALLLIFAAVLTAVFVAGQTIRGIGDTANNTELPPIFVGSVADERIVVSTIVLKKDTPEVIVRDMYNRIEQLYTTERALSIGGRQVKVKEVRVSKLVRDNEGRYMFRVAESPDRLRVILRPYSDYVEKIVAKPVPRTFPALPDGISGREIGPTNHVVRDIIGVTQAERVYGLTGAGVNIAIIDTGVDYGHPDLTTSLRYWSGTYKGQWIREPLVLDADQQQVLLLQDVTLYNSTHIYVGGRYYTVLIPWPVYVYPPCEFYRVSPTVSRWLSTGGRAKFGVTYMLRFDGVKIVGVLVLQLPGGSTYDVAIFDVKGECYFDGDNRPPLDSYARSHFVRYLHNRIIAPDYDGNGYPDDSLGVAGGFFYDFWWYFSYPAEIHPGWDRRGRWLSIFYDFDGHGTAAASAAAGRGVVAYRDSQGNVVRLRGVAPGAGIIGIKSLWVGMTEVGMLWAAGFDISPYNGSFYYTGAPRARIISNSWGISTFIYDYAAFGYDYESVFVAGLTIPGFLHPSFPGVLVIQAGGNGGPGYGTITSPGAAPGVLTVGASTLTYYAYEFTRLNETIWASGAGWQRDEIISWSLRGPTVVGYVKPDVVNVGAFGFTAAPVPLNYTLFGGTSYATPLTAGVAALIYQVLPNADPALVKSIITSTADFIRYDSASQGAGRVNAFRAASLARLLAGRTTARFELLFSSNSLWMSYSDKANNIWSWQWCDNIRTYLLWWAGTDFVPSTCSMPAAVRNRIDSVLFFGDVPQGGSKSITLTIRNPTNRTVAVNISPRQFTVTRVQTLTRHLSLEPGYIYNRTYILLTSTNLTATLRYLEVVATIPYSRFDRNDNYLFDVRVRVWIHLWTRDANGNGRPDPDEMILINYGYARSNWNIATISNPSAKLSGNRGIVISVDLVRGPDAPPYVPPVPVTLTLTTIDTATDPWVSVSPTSTTIAPGGTTTFTLTVRPPSNAIPTTYIGELVV
ncbi:MAG: S8 family serine peptidase, partial [Pyrobaculum sp.]